MWSSVRLQQIALLNFNQVHCRNFHCRAPSLDRNPIRYQLEVYTTSISYIALINNIRLPHTSVQINISVITKRRQHLHCAASIHILFTVSQDNDCTPRNMNQYQILLRSRTDLVIDILHKDMDLLDCPSTVKYCTGLF